MHDHRDTDTTERPASDARDLAVARAEKIHGLLSRREDVDRAVHKTRTGCKRLRATLRLLRSALPKKFYRHENARLRDASRKLSVLRDSVVQTQLIDSVVSGENARLTTVREDLTRDYERAFAKLDGDGFRGVLEEIDGHRQVLEELTLDDVGPEALVSGLRRSYRTGRRAMARAARKKSVPEDFHDWRKHAKYLGYQFALLSTLAPGSVEPWIATLKRLGESLGEHHDLAVLRSLLDRAAVPTDDPIRKTLDERMQVCELEALAAGQQVYTDKPKEFAAQMRSIWPSPSPR